MARSEDRKNALAVGQEGEAKRCRCTVGQRCRHGLAHADAQNLNTHRVQWEELRER